MVLIVLKGKENTGKTTAINYVSNGLRGKGSTESSPKDFEDLGNGDFLTVLEKGEAKIGIISQGDEANKIPNYLKKLKEKNCQKVICALRKKIEKKVDLLMGDKNITLEEVEMVKERSIEGKINQINQKVEEIVALV